jgi:hypothetical protein
MLALCILSLECSFADLDFHDPRKERERGEVFGRHDFAEKPWDRYLLMRTKWHCPALGSLMSPA